ncbi:hypothetical protein ACFLWR_05555 [Chloroflexota bacterium]
MPYIAKLEKAGIPTVVVDFEDQDRMIEETSLASGVPKIRYTHTSRIVHPQENAAALKKPVIEELTRSLTQEETESGRWEPPEQPRILFKGTLDEAQTFYQQTEWVPSPLNAPVAKYTDGYPVIVPTEEKVREMLKGTSHKPDEQIILQSDRKGMAGLKKKGEVVEFQPMNWTATVEKVATIAVMAGCKPEDLPVVLAIAESGCGTGTTVFWGQWACVSGPIVKEIGMNSGTSMLDPGNPANATIGRTYQLMARNLGGAKIGVNRMNSIGSPLNMGGTCFAENADGLPPGWKGLNEEYGFKKDESVVMVINSGGSILGAQHTPAGYRQLQKAGHGGIARKLGLEDIPGPHHWLEYVLPSLWGYREGSYTFVMVPEMAQHLYELGFKSKDEVYQWMWEKSFEPVGDYKKRQPLDLMLAGWVGIEPTSGKPWGELPDDYMVPVMGNDPADNCIIVGGGHEEVCEQLRGRRAGFSTAYSIDAWR